MIIQVRRLIKLSVIKSPYAKTIIIHDHVLDLNHDLPLKYSEEQDHEHDEDQERLYK